MLIGYLISGPVRENYFIDIVFLALPGGASFRRVLDGTLCLSRFGLVVGALYSYSAPLLDFHLFESCNNARMD